MVSVGRAALAIGSVAVVLVGGGSEATGQTPPRRGSPVVERPAVFPLQVGEGKRYLEDKNGKPFLIHGEAAWSLIAQLTRDKVELYFSDRRARGFNTVLVNLLEHRYATNAPANAYGAAPFGVAGDYGSPNEAYFAHVDWVLHQAAEQNFLVLLTASYMGAGGGSEGWYREMAANGTATLRRYGQFLGRRYRHFPNIVWVHGGDYNPPDRTLARAVAEGIRDEDPKALQTAHCAPETAALEYWGGEEWLQVNTIYTYRPPLDAARRQRTRADRMPFFLIEATYENERGITPRELRAQAYQAALAGAAGQVFGNNPIWHFDGPGLQPAAMTWEQALSGPGSRSMMHLSALLEHLSWWRLEPDTENVLVTGGSGFGTGRAVAARATDRSAAVVYMPSPRRVMVDLAALVGPRIAAQWFDPTDGTVLPATDAPLPISRSQPFDAPRVPNSGGGGDWVLILRSRS
jgi:hypothetical protein